MPTLTRQQMLDVITAGGSVMLPTVGIIRTAAEVPTQSALDVGTYDAYSPQAAENALIASRQPRPNTRVRGEILRTGGSAFSAHGEAPTVTGTAGNTFINAAGADPGNALTSLTSGAVSGNQGAVHGAANYRTGNRITWQAYVRPGAVITVARVWAGVFNVSTVTLLGSDLPGAAGQFGFGFRRSTAIPDTNWKAVTSNGAADTVVDTGIAYAASTGYELQIEWEPAAYARFSINGAVVATVTATLPVGASLRQGAGVQTLEAVAKQFDVGWLYIEQE